MAASLNTGVKADAKVSLVHAKDVFTSAQKNLFKCMLDCERAIDNAYQLNTGKRDAAIRVWITAQYNTTMPTFAQYRADHAALIAFAHEEGLKDAQVMRKAYNIVLHEVFGALPESDSPAAIAKRAARGSAGTKAARAKVGAKKGVVVAPSIGEPATLEQMITKFGIVEVFKACQKILATDNRTVLAGKTVGSIADQLKDLPALLQKQASA